MNSVVEDAPIGDAALDYQIYQHACKNLEQEASRQAFEQGYAQGQFHFSSQKFLLSDLLTVYEINLQRLAGEWLASTSNDSAYGQQPLQAVLKLITKLYPTDK